VPTVFERLKKIVVDQLGVEDEQVVLEASFVDDLNADSLDFGRADHGHRGGVQR